MSRNVIIDRALCLPFADCTALIEGRVINAITQRVFSPGEKVALYPSPIQINDLPVEKCYQDSFMPIAQKIFIEQEKLSQVEIDTWAICQDCEIINDLEKIPDLSALTIWRKELLESIIQKKEYLFLTYFRVYRFVPKLQMIAQQTGPFIGLHNITVNDDQPILSDHLWAERYQKILNRQPSPYPELEDLQGAIAQLNTPDTIKFDQYLQTFFGWQEAKPVNLDDPSLAWIKTISKLANSSYGDDFEKIVRKSLLTLGFSNSLNNPKASLDPNATGGAGGIDVYANEPYSLVGECKASSLGKIPSNVCQELDGHGIAHLDEYEDYRNSVKIVFASGEFNSFSENIARKLKMNVMSAETLEKLVTLHAQYPGCIDLWELKEYLVTEPFGQESHEKINKYIAKVRQRLQVRSQMVQAVKQLKKSANSEMNVTEIKGHYNAKYNADLSKQEVRDILIELSSPLTGYLGIELSSPLTGYLGRDDHDCFYFLRDFPYIDD